MAKVAVKEADVRRAVAGARAAGLDVGSVRIQPDGCIIVLAANSKAGTEDEFEKWIADNAHASQGH